MAYFKPTLGESYSRDKIHEMLGGGLQEFLPTKDGRVVAACLRMDQNPHAPERIWVGEGARREMTAKIAVLQGTDFPVFIRREGPNSEYIGRYKALYYRPCRDGEPEGIAGVLTLEAVPAAGPIAVAAPELEAVPA